MIDLSQAYDRININTIYTKLRKLIYLYKLQM